MFCGVLYSLQYLAPSTFCKPILMLVLFTSGSQDSPLWIHHRGFQTARRTHHLGVVCWPLDSYFMKSHNFQPDNHSQPRILTLFSKMFIIYDLRLELAFEFNTKTQNTIFFNLIHIHTHKYIYKFYFYRDFLRIGNWTYQMR